MCVNVFVNGLLSLTKRYIYSQFTLLLFCLMMFVVCLFVSSLPLIIVHFLYLLISWIKSREKPYRQLSKYEGNNLLLFFVSRGVLFAPFDTSLCLFSSCLASMSFLHVFPSSFPSCFASWKSAVCGESTTMNSQREEKTGWKFEAAKRETWMTGDKWMGRKEKDGWKKKAEQKPSGSLFKGLVFSRKKTEYRLWFL